jgi:hypothetical protein
MERTSGIHALSNQSNQGQNPKHGNHHELMANLMVRSGIIPGREDLKEEECKRSGALMARKERLSWSHEDVILDMVLSSS